MNLIECKAKYPQEVEKIMTAVYEAGDSKNIKQIQYILLVTQYPYIPKETKDKIIFDEAMVYFTIFSKGEELLSYLIFDYKIDEKYLNNINKGPMNITLAEELAKKMFKTRTINERHAELTQELSTNPIIRDKRLKV